MRRSTVPRDAGAATPLRLRVPAALVVAVAGASATVALSFLACQEESMPDPVDAGVLEKGRDAAVIDGARDDAGVDGGAEDASVPPDAPFQ